MDRNRRVVAASRLGEALAPALRGAGLDPVGFAADGREALALLRRFEPEVLAADVVLPGLDGPGLAEAAQRLPLNTHPRVLLMESPGLAMPGGDLSELGAARVDRPPSAEELAEALGRLDAAGPTLPKAQRARLSALLDGLGVPEHPGKRALAAAVALAWQDRRCLTDMKRRLYPCAGALSALTAEQAERAMRYAIDAAWRTGSIEVQNRIFGDTIDARRGRPTCGEMIARLADILRWEG